MINKLSLEEIENEILKRKIFREKYGKWILIFFSILFLTLIVVLYPKFNEFVHNICIFREYHEVYSPDAKNKIMVYTLICSSDVFTEISVLDSNSVLTHEHGNVFSALGNPIEFEINPPRWEDNQHIVVETNGKATPYYMENHMGDIEIEYAIVHYSPTQRTPYYSITSTPIPSLAFTPTPTIPLTPTIPPTPGIDTPLLTTTPGAP